MSKKTLVPAEVEEPIGEVVTTKVDSALIPMTIPQTKLSINEEEKGITPEKAPDVGVLMQFC